MKQDMNDKQKGNTSQLWGEDNEENNKVSQEGSNSKMDMRHPRDDESGAMGESDKMGNMGEQRGMNDTLYSGTQARASEGADLAREEDDQSARDNRYSERNESDDRMM